MASDCWDSLHPDCALAAVRLLIIVKNQSKMFSSDHSERADVHRRLCLWGQRTALTTPASAAALQGWTCPGSDLRSVFIRSKSRSSPGGQRLKSLTALLSQPGLHRDLRRTERAIDIAEIHRLRSHAELTAGAESISSGPQRPASLRRIPPVYS